LTVAGSGVASGGGVAVGQEIFDGTGTVTGIKDQISSGVITSAQAFNGNYTVDADGLGRGTIALDGVLQSFYLASPRRGSLLIQVVTTKESSRHKAEHRLMMPRYRGTLS
jgi:hypothetical protein